MGPSSGRHQVNSGVLGRSPPSYPSPASPGPRGLRVLQGMVLCSGHTPSSSSSSLSQQDPRGFCLGPQSGQTGLPTAPPALLPRRTWPLQPSREGSVSTCQAGFTPVGSWRSASSPFLLLDGDSSPGEDSSARRDHSPDWPASTTVCCPPGSPAGGCEAPLCQRGLSGGHQVLQHLQGLDGGPASPPHPTAAPATPLGPGLEEAVGPLPTTRGC